MLIKYNFSQEKKSPESIIQEYYPIGWWRKTNKNGEGKKKENVEINDDENLHAHLQVKTIQILSSPLSRDMKRKEFTPHILFAFFSPLAVVLPFLFQFPLYLLSSTFFRLIFPFSLSAFHNFSPNQHWLIQFSPLVCYLTFTLHFLPLSFLLMHKLHPFTVPFYLYFPLNPTPTLPSLFFPDVYIMVLEPSSPPPN